MCYAWIFLARVRQQAHRRDSASPTAQSATSLTRQSTSWHAWQVRSLYPTPPITPQLTDCRSPSLAAHGRLTRVVAPPPDLSFPELPNGHSFPQVSSPHAPHSLNSLTHHQLHHVLTRQALTTPSNTHHLSQGVTKIFEGEESREPPRWRPAKPHLLLFSCAMDADKPACPRPAAASRPQD
ncbi:hypothetical protein E2C01_052450 [Portunus trituberculatus]|uniref:Uncharacterized protein n=1 Tax=Portunus trituberculatus TaxID=210409 RepID=A0A5B7GLW6_PORTR|nr:hypothetical protein [Portunus trituberculatus]